MKKTQFLVPVFLVLAGLGIYWFASSGPESPLPAKADSRTRSGAGISRETGAGTKFVADHASGDTPQVAKQSLMVPVKAVVPRKFLEQTTVTGKRVIIPLPAGEAAVGVVERFEVDAEGRWVMSEGRIDEPAEGRFIFRRQPEGTPSGRYAGAIRFPDESYGYMFEESATGEPQLTYRDADEVSCVHFPMPPARMPRIDDEAAAAKDFLLPAEHPTDVPIPGYQNGVIPLQSLPGAVGVAYLDFDGEEGPHEGWGDFDAAPSGAGNPQIIEVWSRVAEDFAPFNINVTTDLQVYLDAPETSRQRCIVTPTTNAAPGAGGVAYFNSWNSGGDTPCWAFYSTGKAAAEVISHELGHTLGLGHDGQNPDVGYYGGHGSGNTGWAPIMGVGYYQNLTQWSKGEYLNANETQDDLAVIAGFNSVDPRADDHGDSSGAASPLELFGTAVNDDGVIGTRTDVDVFSFTTTGGTLTLHIAPVGAGPNLDVSAEILNSLDAVVVSSNPEFGIDATFTNVNLTAGTYTLRVDGVGRGTATGDGYTDYASLGHYAIDGTINGAVFPDRFAVNEFPPLGTEVGTVTPDNNHGANPLSYSIVSGNLGTAFAIGGATGTLTVANPAQINHGNLSNGWNDPAEYELYVLVTDAAQPALNETLRVIVTVNDTGADAPVILAHRYSFASDATDSVGNADLTLVGATAVTGGQLNLPGGATRTQHAKAQGAALTELAGTLQGAVAISIEGWFNQDSAQDWAKLFMAGQGADFDYIDITPRRITEGKHSSISIQNDGDVESHAESASALSNNVDHYFAAVWDGSSDRLTLHIGPVGGSLETHTASMNGRTLANLDVSEFYLGSAVYWGDPDFDGQIDEFRIWSGALSDAKVAADFAAGPNPAGDADLDGLPDTWELSFGAITSLSELDGNLNAGGGPGAGTGDFDGDGLSDADEYHGGVNSTDPTDTDSDNDDFPDNIERMLGTDPNNPNDKPGAVLAHRYAFDVDAADAVGHADLTLIGAAAVSGGGLDLPGGAPRTNHAMAQGAALAELAGTINSSYALTVEAWFNQDAAQNWAKLMMAGQGGGYNYMDVTPRRGIDGNVSSISLNNGPAEARAVGSPGGVPLSNGTQYYCAAVWNPLTEQLKLKIGPVGGTLSTFIASTDGNTLAGLNVNEFRIGAAVQFGDPDFDGKINELRVWRGALSDAGVAASFASGPGQPAGDLDDDGLPDEWELSFPGVNHLDDLNPFADDDGDGLNNLAEYNEDTDPTDEDSDNDGFNDGLEVSLDTDPNDEFDKPAVPPTVLAHRYSFATDASDSVGGADLTLVGAAAVTGGALNLPGGQPRTNHASAQGAALTEIEGTIQGAIAISMEGWFRQATAQNWSKVFMAGRGSGGEYLDITPRRGGDGNVSSISFNDGGQESTAIGGAGGSPLAINTDYYCAAVWNPLTDQLTVSIGPVGGTLSTHTASLGGRSLTTATINEFYLGAAVQFPDQDFKGRIDEFRIWSGALTTGEVEDHFALGADVVEAVPVVDGVAMNAAHDTITLNVSGLLPGQTYHLQASATLQGFAPMAGGEFVASGGSQVIHVAVDTVAQPARFFRLVEGPAAAP